jgi:hypothetical protein
VRPWPFALLLAACVLLAAIAVVCRPSPPPPPPSTPVVVTATKPSETQQNLTKPSTSDPATPAVEMILNTRVPTLTAVPSATPTATPSPAILVPSPEATPRPAVQRG